MQSGTERHRTGSNSADSKFLKSVSVLSTKNPVTMRGHAVRKTEYFVVLSVSSFQKFWEEMRNYIHGELSEWSKVQHSKTNALFGSSPLKNLDFTGLFSYH